MTRKKLGVVVFGLLAALLVVAAAFPPPGAAGIVMFAVVVVLVGVVFFRFNPYGDFWKAADELAVRPWVLVAAVLLLAAAGALLRLGIPQAGRSRRGRPSDGRPSPRSRTPLEERAEATRGQRLSGARSLTSLCPLRSCHVSAPSGAKPKRR